MSECDVPLGCRINNTNYDASTVATKHILEKALSDIKYGIINSGKCVIIFFDDNISEDTALNFYYAGLSVDDLKLLLERSRKQLDGWKNERV